MQRRRRRRQQQRRRRRRRRRHVDERRQDIFPAFFSSPVKAISKNDLKKWNEKSFFCFSYVIFYTF